MGKIIDFNQKKAKRKGVSIIKNANTIKIYGDIGHIFIYLNSKNKYEIKKKTESEIKDMICKNVQHIFKQIISEKKAEDVWEDIKKDVLNTKIFYIKMEIPGATYSESFTFEKI